MNAHTLYFDEALQQVLKARPHLVLPDVHCVAAPLDHPHSAGIDLGQDDTFLSLKESFDTLDGQDFTALLEHAQLLLETRTRDLRVGAYMAYALVRVHGYIGLVAGWIALSDMLTRYGTALHPQRPAMRRAALNWLAGERFIDLLHERFCQSETELLLLTTLLENLQSSVAALALPPALEPEWEPLWHRLALLREALQNTSRQASATQTQGLAASAAATTTAPPSPASAPPALREMVHGELRSARDAYEAVRHVCIYLRKRPTMQWPALKLLLCYRWETIDELPPHQNGMTQLPEPREQLRQHLGNLYAQGDWEALWEKSSAALGEAANHFWLDLPFYLTQSAQEIALLGPRIVRGITHETRELMTRLPAMEHLKFLDGTPVCQAATLRWIESQVRADAAPAGPATSPVSDCDWGKLFSGARRARGVDGLHAALADALREPRAVKERFAIRLAFAVELETAGRMDAAWAVLAALEQELASTALPIWEPETADRLWNALHRVSLRLAQKARPEAAAPLHAVAWRALSSLGGADPLRLASLSLHAK